MSSQLHMMAGMQAEMEDLLREIDQTRQELTADAWDVTLGVLDPPPTLAPDVLDEIPRQDITYRQLGTTLIPHPRYSNMKLLEFRTFSGAMAYQPCCRDIDLMGTFKVLQSIEPGADHIFKVARSWSCIIQAIDGLPKDLRWVLAVIYNFSCDMLRSPFDEDTAWAMRPWLMYWYDVADALFELFNIAATAPIPDWFLKPSADTIERVRGPEASSWLTICLTDSVSSARGQMSLGHLTSLEEPQIPASSEPRAAASSRPPDIQDWISAQPDWCIDEQNFDQVQGGSVSAMGDLSGMPPESPQEVAETTPSRLNPEAAEFGPHPNLSTSRASISSGASSMSWSKYSLPSLIDGAHSREGDAISTTMSSVGDFAQFQGNPQTQAYLHDGNMD